MLSPCELWSVVGVQPYIDLIDQIRALGVERDLEGGIPQIAVMGDQSSGKSSVNLPPPLAWLSTGQGGLPRAPSIQSGARAEALGHCRRFSKPSVVCSSRAAPGS